MTSLSVPSPSGTTEPSVEGPCCVCGVTTSQRCSSCAEYGFDSFLCGREHQKLVWFAHKWFCGTNAYPWRAPPLSTAELEIAKRHLHETVQLGEGWISIAHVVQKLDACEIWEVRRNLAEFTGSGLDQYPGCMRQEALCEVRLIIRALLQTHRLCLHTNTTAALSSSDDCRRRMLDVLHPLLASATTDTAFSNIATTGSTPEPRLTHECAFEQPWVISLQHHFLIYFAIRYRQQKSILLDASTPSSATSTDMKRAEYRKLLKDGVKRIYGFAETVAKEQGWVRERLEHVGSALEDAFSECEVDDECEAL